MKKIAPFFCLIVFLQGCVAAQKVVSYEEVKLPESQTRLEVPYWKSSEADPKKNSLNLFLPTGKNWPTLIFVHGGSWKSGDKDLKVLGADMYNNIGRFFASQGIGVAVISYRLMPEVDWKTQTQDVARATAWVHAHIQEYGGDPREIFISGHSAGAQLSARMALEPRWLGEVGLSPRILRGVVAASGAGYDLTDEAVYSLAQKQGLFEDLFFTGNIPRSLRRQLSPIRSVRGEAPPFLILYAAADKAELRHESQKLHERLKSAGAETQLLEVPSEGHKTMVTALSNPVKVPTAAIRVFIDTLLKRSSP